MELSDEDVAAFKEVFDMVDVDGGGSISGEEVQKLMELLGMDSSPEEVATMIADIDQDGNGEVDFQEFLSVMAGAQQPAYSKKELLRAFRLFADKDAPAGRITQGTLEKALVTYCGDKVSEEDLTQLISQLAVDEHGWIDFQQAVDLFMTK
ncbi:hypothetical protein WJX72_011960 [[Myrmecia] bisecta]|uniref:EF-hand domain-containing protein n=1 Tax=[Myrmecia] bisecta TaxID=41462 RepID=A0AAW1QT48_9CHLO